MTITKPNSFFTLTGNHPTNSPIIIKLKFTISISTSLDNDQTNNSNLIYLNKKTNDGSKY